MLPDDIVRAARQAMALKLLKAGRAA